MVEVKSSTTHMTAAPLVVSLNLLNDKLHFIGKAGSRVPIDLDYIPPLGDNLGYMPLELFLISFGTCAASSVLVLLRKMGKIITGLDVKASGVRREQHPTAFEIITLEFILKSTDVDKAAFDKVITLSEESICPIWAMVKNNVKVVVEYTIIP
jgi:putative redox protein